MTPGTGRDRDGLDRDLVKNCGSRVDTKVEAVPVDRLATSRTGGSATLELNGAVITETMVVAADAYGSNRGETYAADQVLELLVHLSRSSAMTFAPIKDARVFPGIDTIGAILGIEHLAGLVHDVKDDST